MRHGKALLGDKVRYTVSSLSVALWAPASPKWEPLMYRCLL